MAKYKTSKINQTVFLQVSLRDQIIEGTIEFAINMLVDTRMDLTRFDNRYKNDQTGSPAYDPRVLFKIVLYGYSLGIISSRKLERACRRNTVFMALTGGQHPDHSKIAAFVSSMSDEIASLFSNVLLVCDEMKLLGGTEFALDGLKLPSNASKRWSGKMTDLQKKKGRLEVKVKKMLSDHVEEDKMEDQDTTEKINRDKKIEKLIKNAERIERFLKENEAKPGKQYKEVKSNITDNDSAMMQTSHGAIQGYNAQALVDSKHQVIVQADAFGTGTDHHHLEPVIDGAKENMAAIGHTEEYFKDKILSADTAYHSTNSIKKCEEEQIDAYIPDKEYRKRHPDFSINETSKASRKKKYQREDFHYDDKTDQYECPQGKLLKCNAAKVKINGVVYRRYRADTIDCEACTARAECINNKGKNGKRKTLMIAISSESRNYSKEMAQKIDTEQARKIYPHRAAIVEPVFANIRTQKRLDRFGLRGKIKVNIQWKLYCMIHNIEKIVNFGHGFATG
jgi:transposase